jgi:hypothetical protein
LILTAIFIKWYWMLWNVTNVPCWTVQYVWHAADLWSGCNTEEVPGDAENIRPVNPSLFDKLLLLECSENVNCIIVLFWLCIKACYACSRMSHLHLIQSVFSSGVHIENSIWNIFLGPVPFYLNILVISFCYTCLYR